MLGCAVTAVHCEQVALAHFANRRTALCCSNDVISLKEIDDPPFTKHLLHAPVSPSVPGLPATARQNHIKTTGKA